MLVRMSGSLPSGFLTVQGTEADPNGPTITPHYRCDGPGDLAADNLPLRPGVILECWNIERQTLPQDWSAPSASPIYRDGLARLREGGVQPSGTFLLANWFLADQSGILLVDYDFPVSPATPEVTELGSLEAWAKSWTSLLESGADGILQASDVERVSAGLPK
jgi:hypothetical protein